MENLSSLIDNPLFRKEIQMDKQQTLEHVKQKLFIASETRKVLNTLNYTSTIAVPLSAMKLLQGFYVLNF